MNSGNERDETHLDTRGIGRSELQPAPAAAGTFAVAADGDRTLVKARGSVVGPTARELAGELERLSPGQHPRLTVDLREADAVDPLVAHALFHAWEQRQQEWGSIRLLVGRGPVARFLDGLALHRAFDIVHADGTREGPGKLAEDGWEGPNTEAWKQAQGGAIEHYHRLFDAARRQDLAGLQAEAPQAHSLCVVAGAEPGGAASGAWCEHCPMRQQYGGCQPLILHILRAAEQGNWEAAQLLILSLIAEAAGTRLPGQDVAGRAPETG